MRATRRRAALPIRLLAPLSALGVVVGCGDDGEQLAAGPVEIVAADYRFEGVPDRVATGSNLVLTNDSDLEVHEVVAVRLPDDESRSGEELAALPMPELMAFTADLHAVVIAPPKATGFAVVGDGSLTEPGRYLLLCVIPTGADPAEYLDKAATSDGPPDVPGGPPHLVHGMWAELTVVE